MDKPLFKLTRFTTTRLFFGRDWEMPFDFATAISLAPGFSPVWVGRPPGSRFNGFFGLPEAAESAEMVSQSLITGLKPGANETSPRTQPL